MNAKSKFAGSESILFSTRLHTVLYSLLMIATPFVMLRSFLQEAIGQLSRFMIPITDNLELPLVPLAALLLVIVMMVIFRRYLTVRMLIGFGVAAILITLSQQTSDFYFGHKFYDLQQNWHYIAYSIFALMMYRDLEPRGIPIARFMILTFFIAMAYSTFDEGFQMHMSNRVFDVSDIAKDVWGVLIGMLLVLISGRHYRELLDRNIPMRRRTLREYLKTPRALMPLLLMLGFILVVISSLLSDAGYWFHVIAITLGLFLIVFLLWHFSRFRWVGSTILILLLGTVVFFSVRFFTYTGDPLNRVHYGYVEYRGIPLPFFDVMIYPDGRFRFVDKKHYFNSRDRRFLLGIKPDILVISSGWYGKGGQGFTDKHFVHYQYNPFIGRGTQIIILPSKQAVATYNRLIKEGKHVLLVHHNTC